jgi:hypothetical protein
MVDTSRQEGTQLFTFAVSTYGHKKVDNLFPRVPLVGKNGRSSKDFR